MSTTTEYNNVITTGNVNVVRTTPQELRDQGFSVVILMGPTGSGKSSFIESLSSDGGLSISKDTLDSVTQEVTCYKVLNVTVKGYEGWHFILMDTPGFLDTKLSESRIATMIISELNDLRAFGRWVTVNVLYFHPITDIRVGGSKRGAIRLLRAFAESFGAKDINVLTTMWNTLSSPKQWANANQRMEALQADIFQQSEDMKIHAYKYSFTRESTLMTISQCYGGWMHDQEASEDVNPEFRSMAVTNLIERIRNTRQTLQLLADDRREAGMPGKENHALLEVIDKEESAALAVLESFSYDLCIVDPEAYRSVFPGVLFPPHPSTPPLQPIAPSLANWSRQIINRMTPLHNAFARKK